MYLRLWSYSFIPSSEFASQSYQVISVSKLTSSQWLWHCALPERLKFKYQSFTQCMTHRTWNILWLWDVNITYKMECWVCKMDIWIKRLLNLSAILFLSLHHHFCFKLSAHDLTLIDPKWCNTFFCNLRFHPTPSDTANTWLITWDSMCWSGMWYGKQLWNLCIYLFITLNSKIICV